MTPHPPPAPPGQHHGPGAAPPRALRIGTVNITSLNTHHAAVAGVEADVLLVQETRITAHGRRAMENTLRQEGRTTLWGAGVP